MDFLHYDFPYDLITSIRFQGFTLSRYRPAPPSLNNDPDSHQLKGGINREFNLFYLANGRDE